MSPLVRVPRIIHPSAELLRMLWPHRYWPLGLHDCSCCPPHRVSISTNSTIANYVCSCAALLQREIKKGRRWPRQKGQDTRRRLACLLRSSLRSFACVCVPRVRNESRSDEAWVLMETYLRRLPRKLILFRMILFLSAEPSRCLKTTPLNVLVWENNSIRSIIN